MNEPVGATMMLPADCYPFVVEKQTAKSYTLREVQTVNLATGHSPHHYCNGFPVWDHTYSAEELQRMGRVGSPVVVRRRQNGRYYDRQGIEYRIGQARYRRNFAD